MTIRPTDEEICAMANRLAKLNAYGCCRDGSTMLLTWITERQAAKDRWKLAEMLRTCISVYEEGIRPEGGLDRWENYMQKVRDTNAAARKLLAEYDHAAQSYSDKREGCL